jgi:hypothetical protein
MAIQIANNRYIIHDNPRDYFRLGGSAWMILTRSAAEVVVQESTALKMLVVGFAGGFWRDPVYEERLDCMYSALLSDIASNRIIEGNSRALSSLVSMPKEYNAFIIVTEPPSPAGCSKNILTGLSAQ